MRFKPAWISLFVLLAGCSDGSGSVVARQITDASDLFGGTDAIGGVGDWYLSNGLVEVVIDDVENQNNLAPSGGTLVDFAHVGRDNDQFNSMYQILMVSQDLPISYETIKASRKGKGGQITVTGFVFVANPDENPPVTTEAGRALDITTVYELREDDTTLYVTTTMVNRGDGPVASAFGTPISDVIFWGDRSAVPFAPYAGRGFEHPVLNVRNPISAFGGYAFIGGRSEVDPPVSYGFLAPEMEQGLIAGVNNVQVSALGMTPAGDPLPVGGEIVYQRRILIGAERTIDSVARQAYAIQAAENPDDHEPLGTLSGQITGLIGGRVAQIVFARDNFFGSAEPITATRTEGTGEFEVRVPAGTYSLEVRSGKATPLDVGPFEVAAGGESTTGAIAAPPLATINFTVTENSNPIPARLTVRGANGTPDPQLGATYSGAVSGFYAYAVDGAGTVAVEPGEYDVYASRGLEYSLATRRVLVGSGDTEDLVFSLTKVVATPGLVSGDFHVHATNSFDSSLETDVRVVALAAEGVEVVVSSEHDYITDYAPHIAVQGLDGVLTSITGIEVTGAVPTPTLPRTIGHNNMWPVTPAPGMARNGAPKDERIEPAELFERLRAIAAGTPVIQLNHPRASSVGTIGLGYFTNFGFNPDVVIPDTDDGGTNAFFRRTAIGGTQNIDFDAMEIFNGAGWAQLDTNQQNFRDWVSLLKQGFLVSGTANSDSHQTIELAGFPRTYVNYAADTPVGLEVETFDAAFLAGELMGTSGPVIRASVGGVGPGQTHTIASAGTVPVSIRVESAPWLPVEEIRVSLNGELVCTIGRMGGPEACPGPNLSAEPADAFSQDPGESLRYDGVVDVPVAADGFVIVEAGMTLPAAEDRDADGVLDTWDTDGDGDLADEMDGALPSAVSPVMAAAVVPDLLPWGFINPVFIDVGADGWSPPGL